MLIELRLKESEYEKELLQKEIDRIKSIQAERDRISRDLHDDIGSGLSALKLQAEYLESLPKKQWTNDNLQVFVHESQEITNNMREIVWSLNTQYDNLVDFAHYIRRYGVQYFDKCKVNLKIQIPENISECELNGLKRRNIFLVYKEALHNVIRHSRADEVQVNLKTENNELQISIQDNGIGFDQKMVKGNGLQSMQYRMESINGRYEVVSAKNGTKIFLAVIL